jgi:DNA-binding MurR/RpiR family transcriptional regulator
MTEEDPVKRLRLRPWEATYIQETVKFDDRGRVTPESMKEIMETTKRPAPAINRFVTKLGLRPFVAPKSEKPKPLRDHEIVELLRQMKEDQQETVRYLREIRDINQRIDAAITLVTPKMLTELGEIRDILNREYILFDKLSKNGATNQKAPATEGEVSHG